MHKPIKYAEKGLSYAAKGAWAAYDAFISVKPNAAFRSGPSSRCRSRGRR
jgi:hypothetical protein